MNPGRLSGVRIRIPLVIIGVLFVAVILFVVFAPGTRRAFVIPEFEATGIESIEFSSDGRFLAMVPMTGDFVSVWGVAPRGSLRRMRLLRLSGWRPTCSAFFPSNGTVAIGCHRDTGNPGESEGESAIVVFDLSSQSVQGTWRFFRGQVSAIGVSPDAQAVAAGTRAGVVTLWRTGRQEVEERDFSELADAHSGGVNCVKFSPTGDALAVAVGSTALLVDPLTLEVRHTLTGHGVPTAYPVNDLDFSGDARDLASIGNDGTTRIWDTLI